MEIFTLYKAIENEKLDLEMAISLTQESKGATFSIPKKKEGTCKSNEWSLVYWRKNWRIFPFKKLRWSKWCNQRTLRKEWFPARRSKETKKRTRNLVNMIMWNLGIEKQDKRRNGWK